MSAKRDSVDARFARLIRDEFGEDVTRKAPEPQWFSLDRAIDDATPDAEPFEAPEAPPLRWPQRPLVWVGLALLALAVAVGVWALIVAPPVWARWAGGAAVAGGLACLLFSIPRHRDDPLDDGAVV